GSMMKTNATLLLGLLLANVPLSGADADLKANISEAAKKLADQSSYGWKTIMRTEGGGPFGGGNTTTTGQIEKDGYTWVSPASPNSSVEFARKADKTAVVLDGNWMTMDQAAARSSGGGGGPFGGGGFNPSTVTDFKMP